MVGFAAVLLVCGAALVAGVPVQDLVISRPSTPRYQYVQSPNGLGLVDVWVKSSDISAAARYSPDSDNIYYFFSRAHPNIGYPLLLGDDNLLAQVNFDPTKRTIVLVHGWLGSVTATSNLALIPAFLTAEDVNVIVVDWNAGAGGSYISAVTNTVTSGLSVARFIDWLNAQTGASVANYHIVGHSLGGHMVGIIGRNVNGEVAYITGHLSTLMGAVLSCVFRFVIATHEPFFRIGYQFNEQSLDPALPLWILNSNKFRADDGAYTEVIHTNVGVSGYLKPLGHVDFYPNGGINMAGCDGQNCDHDRCFWYMAESIVYGGFTGTECASLLDALRGNCNLSGRLQMGSLVPNTGYTGIYHLITNAGPPFSIY